MFLEIIIYLVVVIALSFTIRLIFESLYLLVETKAKKGVGKIIICLSSLVGTYYFYNDSISLVEQKMTEIEYSRCALGSFLLIIILIIINKTIDSNLEYNAKKAEKNSAFIKD